MRALRIDIPSASLPLVPRLLSFSRTAVPHRSMRDCFVRQPGGKRQGQAASADCRLTRRANDITFMTPVVAAQICIFVKQRKGKMIRLIAAVWVRAALALLRFRGLATRLWGFRRALARALPLSSRIHVRLIGGGCPYRRAAQSAPTNLFEGPK